jgi:DNA-binding NtrC family response regulator
MAGLKARRVLLVEDDILVRLAVREALVEAHFDPIDAANASEAVAVLHARPDVLAVISDIDTPGPMNGISLAWEVKNRSPRTPVMLISGRCSPTLTMLPQDVAFLAKPFPLEVLIDQVERMVDTVLGAPLSSDAVVLPFKPGSREA